MVQAAVDALAGSIASAAHEAGRREDDEQFHTPFEQAAAQEGYRFAGGKLDDVAIVCGVVRKGAAPEEQPPLRSVDNFVADEGVGAVIPTARDSSTSATSSDTAI